MGNQNSEVENIETEMEGTEIGGNGKREIGGNGEREIGGNGERDIGGNGKRDRREWEER